MVITQKQSASPKERQSVTDLKAICAVAKYGEG